MSVYLVSDTDLTSIANAIRTKGGTNAGLAFPTGFVSAIGNISTGGGASSPRVEYTFDSNAKITSAKLYGFTEILPYMFYNQGELTSVDLSESPNITKIGEYAFYNCQKLTLSSIPSGVTRIGQYAFFSCTEITVASLPSGITSLGRQAFSGCAKITLSALPSGITTIPDSAFIACTQLTISSLPSGVTSIGASAFSSCHNITISALPSGIKTIGNNAFDSCRNITISKLPSSITSVGNSAFYGCNSITNMEIACSKLGTGTKPFSTCTNLQKVWFRDTCTTVTASSAAAAPFAGCSTNLAIYAEASSKPSGWGKYFNRTGTNGATEVTVTYGQTTKPWSD